LAVTALQGLHGDRLTRFTENFKQISTDSPADAWKKIPRSAA